MSGIHDPRPGNHCSSPKPFSHGYPEDYGAGPGPGRPYQTFMCQRCGAVVMGITVHSEWHAQFDSKEVSS